MKTRTQKLLLAGLVCGMLWACQDKPPPVPAASCRQTPDSKESGASLTQNTSLDFQKDILPILSSNKDDEVYKCTTCHAAYAKEESFNREKLDAIVAQVEGLRMPLNGDEMRKEQIQLIKAWRDQKFPAAGPSPGGGSGGTTSDVQGATWDDEEWSHSEEKPRPRC